MHPGVSIILPVYNVAGYLRDCLDSLCHQTFRDFEIIAVNDGSVDNSLQILESNRSRFSFFTIISQENRGLSAARNRGLQLAKGKYVYFMDSDDTLATNALADCYALAEENSLDVVKFKVLHLDVNGREKIFPSAGNMPAEAVMPGKKLLQQLLEGRSDWMMAQSFFFNSLFLQNTTVLFKEGLIHEDVLFTPQILWEAKRTAFLDKELYYYHTRSQSIVQASLIPARIKALSVVAEELYDFYRKNKKQEDSHILLSLCYKRYLNLLEFIELQQEQLTDFAAYWSNMQKIIRKKKDISISFLEIGKEDFLYKYHVPAIRWMGLQIKKYLYDPVRRIFQYQVKKWIIRS